MCLLLDMLFLPLYYADVCVIGFSRLLRLFPVKLRVLLPSPLLPFTTSHLLRTTPGKCHFSDTKSKVLLPLLSLQKSYLLNTTPKNVVALNINANKALFSPRAGPKGLRAESARAVTGRRCPHSGKGEDFLTGQPDFFTETAVTPERKVEKSFPRWEINRHGEG